LDNSASDQFFPWVAANNGRVFVSYLDHRNETGHSYHASIVASSDHGNTWTAPGKISNVKSDPSKGNRFNYPDCKTIFIGDYTGIAVGSDGVAHPFWIDVRMGNSGPGKADQDPFTTTVTIE
jgi:hypothetical protein